MGLWVFGVMAPVEQFWADVIHLSFSVAEVLVVLVLTGSVAWLAPGLSF